MHKGDKPQEGWYAVKRKKRQGCASVSWFLNLTLLRHLTGFHRHLARGTGSLPRALSGDRGVEPGPGRGCGPRLWYGDENRIEVSKGTSGE